MENNEDVPDDYETDEEFLSKLMVIMNAKIGINRGQYFVRLPKEVSSHLRIEKDSIAEFLIDPCSKERKVILWVR